jgi:tetratricopeptide (TPR) repeat protein
MGIIYFAPDLEGLHKRGFLDMHTHRGKALGLILIALLGLSAIGTTSGCSNVQQKWNMLKSRRAFKQANAAYANKSYNDAINLYNQTLELDPNPDPRVLVTTYFYRGSSHHLMYRPSRPDDPENEKQLEAAIADYQKAQELAVKYAAEYSMLAPYEQYSMEQLAAIYRDNLDDFQNAEKYFKALIELDPKTPERYYALADVYERFNDPEDLPLLEQAIEAYKKPVELHPEDPIAYRQVANLLNKYGRFDETMEWLAKARDVQANNPEGYYLIAVHYWDKVYRDPSLTDNDKKSYIQLGLDQLDKALQIDDQYIDALIYKNLLLREQAKVEPKRKAELEKMANELRDKAMELKEKKDAAEKAAKAAAEAAKQQGTGQQPPSGH